MLLVAKLTFQDVGHHLNFLVMLSVSAGQPAYNVFRQ